MIIESGHPAILYNIKGYKKIDRRGPEPSNCLMFKPGSTDDHIPRETQLEFDESVERAKAEYDKVIYCVKCKKMIKVQSGSGRRQLRCDDCQKEYIRQYNHDYNQRNSRR